MRKSMNKAKLPRKVICEILRIDIKIALLIFLYGLIMIILGSTTKFYNMTSYGILLIILVISLYGLMAVGIVSCQVVIIKCKKLTINRRVLSSPQIAIYSLEYITSKGKRRNKLLNHPENFKQWEFGREENGMIEFYYLRFANIMFGYKYQRDKLGNGKRKYMIFDEKDLIRNESRN